jgi:signal peptidase I
MEQFRSESIPDNPPQQERGYNGVRRTVLDLLETVALSVILFLGINTITARIRIESISMQPTLYADDLVLVNRLAYKFGSPRRGDIIIFQYPPDPNREPYIKRVIGLPGDHIQVGGGQILINGEVIDEPYLKAEPNYAGSWVVPKDSLFVLGDNRNRSSDSHSWGMVPMGNVMGKALVLYWPPKDWKFLDVTIAVAADQK